MTVTNVIYAQTTGPASLTSAVVIGSPTTTLAIAVSQVPPMLLGPDKVYECTNNLVSWAGGLPPYRLELATQGPLPLSWPLVMPVYGNSFSWFNRDLRHNQTLVISIVDQLSNQNSKSFVVQASSDAACLDAQPDTIPSAPHAASTATSGSQGLASSPGIIVSIVLVCVLILAVPLAWFAYWRHRKPTPISNIQHNDQCNPASDKQSIKSVHSARSFRSIWSTFSQKKSDAQSIEYGVHVEIDTVRVTDEISTPTSLTTAVPFLAAPQQARQWSSYPLPVQPALKIDHALPAGTTPWSSRSFVSQDPFSDGSADGSNYSNSRMM